jgi:Ca2+-binding EF-hand superfamily protein
VSDLVAFANQFDQNRDGYIQIHELIKLLKVKKVGIKDVA